MGCYMKSVDNVLNGYVDLISTVDNYIKIRHDIFLSYLDLSNNEVISITNELDFNINNLVLSHNSWVNVLENVNNKLELDFNLSEFSSFLYSYGYCNEYNYNKSISLDVVFKSILRINTLENDEIFYFTDDFSNGNGTLDFNKELLTISSYTDNYEYDNIYSTTKIKKYLLDLLLNGDTEQVIHYLNKYVVSFLNVLFYEIKSKESELSLNILNTENILKENNLNKLKSLINLYPEESKGLFKDLLK